MMNVRPTVITLSLSTSSTNALRALKTNSLPVGAVLPVDILVKFVEDLITLRDMGQVYPSRVPSTPPSSI